MPSLPPEDQLPTGVDSSKPGVAVKPVTATASSALGGNTAAMAIDGNTTTTRWESEHGVDPEWIMFDFGAKTQLGSMRLVWEGAYAKEYAIQGSVDGTTWYQLRYRADGTGGVEDWMNLNAFVQYIRVLGIARGSTYGYSLYEVQFESPGSDNTPGAKTATAAYPFPKDGSQLAPPPAQQPPIETVKFTLPDGRIVTRLGVVGRPRHGRERGEQWNEIGYGPNDTVDANGNPQDLGPGTYLEFVPDYFMHRTWLVELIDNSKVPGVTKPSITVNQYFKEPQKAGGQSFFRGRDRVGVTGYGWDASGDLVDPTLYGTNLTSCKVQPLPPDTALATPSGLNDGCTTVLSSRPGESALSPDANGVLVPNGTNIPARNLKVGDIIEFTTAFFSTVGDMVALPLEPANPGIRYYTTEFEYIVGDGLHPWMGIQPRLDNYPLPPETLEGGMGTVSYDYADDSSHVLQQPFNDVGGQNMQRFVEGRRKFHSSMTDGKHNEPGNLPDPDLMNLQGALFNQHTCFSCHTDNGRSMAPVVVNQRLDTFAVLTAQLDANGNQVPHPIYGISDQMDSAPSTNGVRTDWGTTAAVGGFQTQNASLADGTVVQLSKPTFRFDSQTPDRVSVRIAPPITGMGLIAAINDADIISHARATPDADGVMGIVNYGYDPDTGNVCVGRFGWKASKCTLRHQAAAAAMQDLAVTTPIYPSLSCMYGPTACSSGTAAKGLTNDMLVSITNYLNMVAVPAFRNQVSGFPKGVTPLAPLSGDPTQINAGAAIFDTIKCSACHIKNWTTGTNTQFDEARNQKIMPYSDFLLHDVGTGDGFVEGQADGNHFRTAPLWAFGYAPYVAKAAGIPIGYLHDGRARTPTEAIMWHSKEGAASAQRFAALSATDRAALLAFLAAL